MTVGKKWPCHDCPDRVPPSRTDPGCHSSCSRYLDEVSKHGETAKAAKEKNLIIDEYIGDSVRATRGSRGQMIKNYRPKERR